MLCEEIESPHVVSWICELVCKNITLSLNRQRHPVLPDKKNAPDAPDIVICCATHDTVRNKIEKHCEHNAVLPDTSLDFKLNVTMSNTAGNVAKEASDVLKLVLDEREFHRLEVSARGCTSVHCLRHLQSLQNLPKERTLPFGSLFNNFS